MSFFDGLETELLSAARRRARWRFRLGGPLALAGAVAVAGGALAATGQIELGSPDPPAHHSPSASHRGLGVPRPASSRLLAVRAPDPAGGPPWGIRVYRSSRGYRCAQYGRVVAGRLTRLGLDGKAHELALHCHGTANPGSFGNTGRLYYGYVGPRARNVLISQGATRLTLPVRDGAYLAVLGGARRQHPRITVVLDDGTHMRQSPSAPPIPGTLPARPTPARPVKPRSIVTSARVIAPGGELLVAFRAPVTIGDGRTFFRAEANGPHGRDCAGRVLAASDRDYTRGDRVRLRLRRPNRPGATLIGGALMPWCRGSFRGRVSISGRTTVGSFSLTVR